jgi:hypothetical protein
LHYDAWVSFSHALQRAQISKFRERWAKLKESAKKKKSARAAAEAGRIEEEPEAEAEEAEI